MSKSFYSAPVYGVSNTGVTSTQEKSISLASTSGVNLKIYVPCGVDSVLVYRSTSSNSETLIEELVLEGNLKKQTKVSFLLNYNDTGLTPGVDSYPLTSDFTPTEMLGIPEPDFDLEEIAGSLPAGDYYYRVAFKTLEPAVFPRFTKESVDVFVYQPDLAQALFYTDADLTLDTDYVEVTDPYSFVDSFYGDVFKVGLMVGTKLIQQQELVFGGGILKKSVLDAIPVDIQLANKSYLVNTPITMVIDPPYANLEILENKLVGTPEYLKGTIIKRYSDPGSITFYLTIRGRFIYAMSTPFFKVVT